MYIYFLVQELATNLEDIKNELKVTKKKNAAHLKVWKGSNESGKFHAKNSQSDKAASWQVYFLINVIIITGYHKTTAAVKKVNNFSLAAWENSLHLLVGFEVSTILIPLETGKLILWKRIRRKNVWIVTHVHLPAVQLIKLIT